MSDPVNTSGMGGPARRFLAPAGDCRVRKPDGQVLSASGEWVVFDTYWQRRLDEGSVDERVSQAPPPSASSSNASVKVSS